MSDGSIRLISSKNLLFYRKTTSVRQYERENFTMKITLFNQLRDLEMNNLIVC